MAKQFFDQLVYALGDEDTSVELGVMPEGCEHVASVAGSGGRVVPLLAKQPRRLTCVDISPIQLAITEMRLAALRALSFEDYVGFLGLPPGAMDPATRRDCFDSLTLSLPGVPRLRALFADNQWAPIVYQGRFETMLMKMTPIIRLLAGRRGQGIFDATSIEEQNQYYRELFPRRRWKLVVFILGNAPILNALLYRGAFPKKNIPGSAYSFYRQRFEHLFLRCPVRTSFFLQLLFWRELRFAEGNPIEAQASIFAAAKQGIESADVRLIQGDLMETIAGAADHTRVDFCSLSDVPSFLPPERETRFLQEIRPGLHPDAVVVTRGHMRVPVPDISAYNDITASFDELIQAETTQLWHIHIYKHNP